MRRWVYVLPLVAFVALAGYFANALLSGRDPREIPSVMIDKPMPTFDLKPLGEGAPVTSAALKGKVTVVNFFASWCVPCRLEHPILMRLANQEKIDLTGIAYKDKAADAGRLLKDDGDPYRRVGMDLNGRTGIDFGVYGVPETYVIDRTGRIRRKFTGPLTPQQVDHELLPLLRKLEASS